MTQEKINVAELLKDCPKGMELDCIIFNNAVKYESANDDGSYPISIRTEEGELFCLNKYGCLYDRFDSKCAIFPKGKTTWEGFVPPHKFDIATLVPFESKVLVRGCNSQEWVGEIFTRYNNKVFDNCNFVTLGGICWKQCIPYKDDTKHLLGTTDDCNEFYKTWE